jgi:hypothetical protein
VHNRPSDRTGTPTFFQVASEALDVSAACVEQPKVILLAAGDELAKVQGVGVAGQSPVAGEEGGERVLLGVGQLRVDDCDVGREGCGGHVAPPGQAETQEAGHRTPASS